MISRACQCGGIVTSEGCSRCGNTGVQSDRKLANKARPTSSKRGYDYKWQKVRKLFLKRNPLCHDCKKRERMTEATQVHHIRKIADRPDLRLSHSNLMALCGPCHTVRSMRGE